MDLSELQLAAARYVAHLLLSEELPGVADAALTKGICTQALIELSSVPNPIWSETGPLFEKALKELQIPFPNRDEAAWIILRHHIPKIAK